MNIKIIPTIRYTNFKKKYGQGAAMAFKRWVYCRSYWSGKVINIGIKHFQLSFDFTKNWLLDMIRK